MEMEFEIISNGKKLVCNHIKVKFISLRYGMLLLIFK